MPLANELKKQIKKEPEKSKPRKGPVWAGPSDPGPQGGITFSLLSRFLVCRERFRLLVVEGLKPAEVFSHRIHYGSMWHVCEETFAKLPGEKASGWEKPLQMYCHQLCKQFPTQQGEVDHWYQICKVQFPLYVDFWSKHKDVRERTPLLQEQVFNVPCELPSGRIVRLRGKWDSVDLIGKGKGAGVYLQENKTKSRIEEQQIRRQMSMDLQTMMYLVALGSHRQDGHLFEKLRDTKTMDVPICGVRYNVIRRTEHRIGKKETQQEFLDRLRRIIETDPQEWFMRWKVEVSPEDVVRFRRECLDPILEGLCAWWDYMKECVDLRRGNPWNGPGSIVGRALHWREPFGVYNPLLEGRPSDLDQHLATGTTVGLQRTAEMFPELV